MPHSRCWHHPSQNNTSTGIFATLPYILFVFSLKIPNCAEHVHVPRCANHDTHDHSPKQTHTHTPTPTHPWRLCWIWYLPPLTCTNFPSHPPSNYWREGNTFLFPPNTDCLDGCSMCLQLWCSSSSPTTPTAVLQHVPLHAPQQCTHCNTPDHKYLI